MDKKQPLSYQVIAQACQQLLESGETPSVRKLNELTKGSFSTISGHLRQWRAKNAQSSEEEFPISEKLRRAILVEISEATQKAKEQLEERVAAEDKQFQELQELLAKNEKYTDSLEKLLKESKKYAQIEKIGLEKELAIAGANIESHAARETRVQLELKQLREKCSQLEVKAAIADTQAKEYKQRLATFERQKEKK